MTLDFKQIEKRIAMMEVPILISTKELENIPKEMVNEPIHKNGFPYMVANEKECELIEANTGQIVEGDFIALIVVEDAETKRLGLEWKEFIKNF